MKDTDGPRTEPGRFGADGVPPDAGSSRAPADADDDGAPSFLRDAGAVVASAVAERPLTSIFVASGFATLGLDRAAAAVGSCPAWWVLLLVFVAATAGAALVRGERRIAALCVCLLPLAPLAIVSPAQTTATIVALAAGAAGAVLLIRGSARALRWLGATTLAAGLVFAAGWGRWRLASMPTLETADEIVGRRPIWESAEVAIIVGAAAFAVVVRSRVATLTIFGSAALLAVDYVATFGSPLLWGRNTLIATASVAVVAAALRASATASDAEAARGRLLARLQRHAWPAGAVSLLAVPCFGRWTGLLPDVDDAFGESTAMSYRPTGLVWDLAARGVAAAGAAAICVRLGGRAPLLRAAAVCSLASLLFAVTAWMGTQGRPADLSLAIRALIDLGEVAPACSVGAVIAAFAPSWSRRALWGGLALATVAAAIGSGAAAFLINVPFSLEEPLPEGPLWASGAAWGAAATLVAVVRPRWGWAILAVVACALTNELVMQAVLATTLREPPPFRFNIGAVLVACFYTLTLTVVVRAFCSWTPVPESHPIHNDFDVLGRSR